ncbi:MAG: ABC transporter substrate-binding protein [Firmicutes bacterium]|nr:ABC transporter substrate-binding protein [Bacillota bacterium]
MSRRLSVALLVVMLATLVAGCGGEKGDIIIGHFAPMSGDTAAWGQMEVKGVNLAVEEINAAGGVLGRKIKVISYDDRGDKVEAVNVVKKLISEKAVAIVGEQTSSASMAAGPIVAAAKIPAVATAATNPRVTVGEDGKLNPFYFRVCFIDPFQGRALAFYAVKRLNKTKAAILYDIGEDYAVGLADSFKKNFKELGGQVVAEETFKGGEEDFRAQLTRIKQFNPEIIVIPIYYKEAALAMKQARELGINAVFMGGDGLESPTLTELGGPAVEGCYFSSHYSSEDTTPKVKKFIDAFKAKFKEDADVNTALGYDGVYMIADAIKRAGKVDPQAIRDALEKTKDFEGVTGKITVNPQDHNPQDKTIVINTVKNGKIAFQERLDLTQLK